jgi:hypothetical protein
VCIAYVFQHPEGLQVGWAHPCRAQHASTQTRDRRKAHDAAHAFTQAIAAAAEGRACLPSGHLRAAQLSGLFGRRSPPPRVHRAVGQTRRYSIMPTDRWSRTGESLRAARSSVPASSCRRRHVASPHIACCVAFRMLHVACCVVCCVADDPGTLPSYSQEGLARLAVVFAIDATGTRPPATLRH